MLCHLYVLYQWSNDEVLMFQSLMDKRIKPWVTKKIVEYIGEEEPTLTDFICQKVVAHSSPQSIQNDVAMVSNCTFLLVGYDTFHIRITFLLLFMLQFCTGCFGISCVNMQVWNSALEFEYSRVVFDPDEWCVDLCLTHIWQGRAVRVAL